MAQDYYSTLGISKSASTEEIKKAYRKLAHQYHPDKGAGNEQKFKEVSEAYQVLSDPNKRAQYDQFGTAFQNAGRGGCGQCAGCRGVQARPSDRQPSAGGTLVAAMIFRAYQSRMGGAAACA